MNMQLIVISGPDQGRSFSLTEGGTLLIGRGQASNTQLRDPRISRIHCQVEVDRGKVRLIHSGGSGGTLVKGEPVDQQELQPGDVVRIGDTELRFQLEGAPEESTLVTPGLSKPKPRPKVAPLKDLVGQSLAHFELQELIAQGTTGMVFRAHDAKEQRPVAMKVLEPAFAGDVENM